MPLRAFFLTAAPGQRLCLLHTPPTGQPVRGGILHLHPFAEELNCTRRVAALQARDLAAAGYIVLQIDLYGCGDSSGDFAEATWLQWQEDARCGLEFLAAQTSGELWLWGLRAGCLLAAQAAACPHPTHLLFWQPVLTGAQILRHFLRLQLAGDTLAGGDNVGSTRLRQRLAAGETLEIAGYGLSPAMAETLEAAVWPDNLSPRRIECLEIGNGRLSTLLSRQISDWQARGHAARTTTIDGPAFWLTPGTADFPALRQATLSAITGAEA